VERVVAPRRATEGSPPPLLVLLHGIGSNENDLVSFAGRLDPRFLVVSLRAPRPYHGGFAWFQITWRSDGSIVPDVDQAHATLADLVRWLAAAPARLGADARRVYLMGFSQGAMMSLGVLSTAPERLAGLVALSGLFRDDLVETPADAGAIGGVAVFVAHGSRDDLLPIADGRAVRDHFQPMVRDFTYREYEMPHTIAPDEVRDVAAWLTAHLDR
jgi:phospholipase/carboxylesterase